MLKCVYLLFVISVSLFLASCTDESSTSPSGAEDKKEIMPLAVGNEWEYTRYYYDTSGIVINKGIARISCYRAGYY